MTTVIVLGMHRSGTSLCASLLQGLGVDMGQRLLGKGAGNPRGHFEDRDFLDLNEKVLAAAGGSWSNPPHEDKIMAAAQSFIPEAGNLFSARHDKPLWGWKDPRTILTIRMYCVPPAAGFRFVCTHRPLDEIIDSLIRRNGGDAFKWEKLAEEYDDRRYSFLREIPAENTFEFDYTAFTDKYLWPQSIQALADFLGLMPPEGIEERVIWAGSES